MLEAAQRALFTHTPEVSSLWTKRGLEHVRHADSTHSRAIIQQGAPLSWTGAANKASDHQTPSGAVRK